MLRLIFGLCGIFLTLSVLAEQPKQPVAVPVMRLSLDTAIKAAMAGLTACRQKGLQTTVAVVDRDGHPQAVLRDVFSPHVTVDIAQRKAYTAAAFILATSVIKDPGLAEVHPFLFLGGGVPIEAGGTVYGAIGVAGAPSPKQDEECAVAGQKAIQHDLELM